MYANFARCAVVRRSSATFETINMGGRHGRRVVGQAERGDPAAMGKWARARAALQVWEWFRAIPDFILTFDASYASICSDAQWCALCEHELSHCGVERDAFGAPKFK